MAQSLTALTALSEDLGLVLSSHGVSKSSETPFPDPTHSSGLLGPTRGTYAYSQALM